MALRIPWDKQETALLLDAYQRVKCNELSRQDAIKEVSMLLRCRAILSGIKIDETFRNENGISMQMKIIGGLLDEKPSGLHKATKLFTEIVTLYKNNRLEFDEILIQAKGECTMKVNVKDNFFRWLSTKIQSSQASEFYAVCKDVETFCLEKDILNAPLFETTDFETLQYVKNTIYSNLIFQIKYFRQIGKMKKFIKYYIEFLSENPVQKTIPINSTEEKMVALESININEPSKSTDFDIVKKEEIIDEAIIPKHIEDRLLLEEALAIEKDDKFSALCNDTDTFIAKNENNNSIWNFANEKIDFNLITPIEVSYFGEKRKSYGWQKAFIYIIDFLLEDYPAIIRGMGGYYFDEVGKVIFSGRNNISMLSKAEKIYDGLYLETDCTPDDIITILYLLMDKCNLDYDNIEIIYEKEHVNNLSVLLNDSLELPIIEEHASNICMQTENNAMLSSDSILPIKTVEKTEKQASGFEIEATANSQIKERYIAILAENFVDGFRPEKAIDRNRFRMYYFETFGQELIEEDEQLVRTLISIGTFRDDRIFVKDDIEQKNLVKEINDTITETFNKGASCIYLDCLFDRFQEKLAEMLHIYNLNSLENILFTSQNRNYFKRYNYLFGYNKDPEPSKDVFEYMKKSNLPVNYSELERNLWYIPLDKIKHILVTIPSIVNVAPETYLYAPNLPVSEDELQKIIYIISNALLQRRYLSDVELMQLIDKDCPSVIINTEDYPIWGFRNALAYLLRERFSFKGAIISDKNTEISMAEVFSEFCRQSEYITVEEIKKFANDLNTVIYWDSVYGEMVRINEKEFVRRDKIHFNIKETDEVLEKLIWNEYAPIKSINLFLHFPTIDVPWNSFVLESFVANYSEKFRLIHASYSATDCCGAIVRQESRIHDYRSLIVDALSKNIDWETKKDALQFLVDLGYQQRRSYSDIEKVIQEAKNIKRVQNNKKIE